MRYQVVVPKKVRKELDRIDHRYRLKILAAFVVLASDPFFGKKLEGEFKGRWSYRVWSYRIIYRIRRRELVVLVLNVGHRQGIYK